MVNNNRMKKNSTPKYPLRKSKSQWMMFLILMILPLLGFAKTLSVSTDRQTVEMGDIITLIIQADFQTRGSQLDLDRLNDQFEVLGRQQNNQISIINGQFSSNTQWRITLLAKQIGELTVPPLRIEDVESKPYKIKVIPAHKKSTNDRGRYFLDTSLSKEKVYVQEEVLYSLKFYFLGAFQGNIRPPVFENSLTVTLKEQDIYGKQINGKHYTVYEWLYAVYPQQSGQLVIKGPVFSGIHQYRNQQKGIQEVAKTQTLTVLPEPIKLKKSPNDPWLPATSLRLSQKWQSLPNTLRVGDSITRTLILDAQGLRASQVPTLSFKNNAEFKIYNDQPITEETLTEQGINSQLQQTQTLILTQSGQITLPEQQVNWFNTQTQKMETAILSSRTLTILPALNAPSSNTNNTVTPTTTNQETSHTQTNNTAENVSRETSLLWPVISTLLSLAWLITLILWRKQVKRLKAQQHKTENKTNHPVQKMPQKHTLCNPNSTLTPRAFYHELRAVLQQDHRIHSFSELNDHALKDAINQLEKHLFYQADLADSTLATICEGLNKLTKKNSTPEYPLLSKLNSPCPPPSHKKSKLASLYGSS
ncbi:Aerotolerance protein BatD [hydrothermal vent metagenome]|uniref:Aerotolerance protein BatD n=1 Tax=hydrothermal vent metagenome TaxID=652676 RepID=A0A3B0W1M1_9ZZZZ